MNNSSWMSAIPDDRLITGINIPGTHDSAACYCAFSFISRTQKLTVSQQLEAGARYFDFRFRSNFSKLIIGNAPLKVSCDIHCYFTTSGGDSQPESAALDFYSGCPYNDFRKKEG